MTGIDWTAFLLVLGCALVGAVLTVALYSVGVRLLATPRSGSPVDFDAAQEIGEDDPTARGGRPGSATVGAGVVFGLAALVAAAGVVLIVH